MSHAVPVLEAGEVSVTPVARRVAIYGWISMAVWIIIGMDLIVRSIRDNRRETFWWFPFFL